ncbi:MAG: flagellar biosynthesis protein FlhB [Gammaproteobacteria bacterium]|nr:flagellar biosynthesis protein FlhB [Gammaproteobacteria bacterium]
MAERDDVQERSFEATAKRHADAREKGQVPRSREVATVALLLAGSGGLMFGGQSILDMLVRSMHTAFAPDLALLEDDHLLFSFAGRQLLDALVGIGPFLALMFVVALFAPIAVGGWVFSAEALAAKPARLDPIAGLGRVFGARGWVELAKALVKFALILGVAFLVLWSDMDHMLATARAPVEAALRSSIDIVAHVAAMVAAATIAIAIFDVPFQIWDHGRNLRMSREDLREETKETEGRPEVRARIRSIQQALAQRRMMAQVPKADVIVTNPTHYAVALRYEAGSSAAPVLVAKGADHVAARIREVGAEAGVAMLSAPLLARALYFSTDIDEEIPAGLYRAVAQVLAYVFQLRALRPGERAPNPPTDLPIPEDLRRD